MSMINKKQLVNVAMLSALTVGAFAFGPKEISAEEGYVPISRIEGKDRYETAAFISNETYASADTVVIANAMNFADALSGVPLAYQNDAPILLAQGTKLKASIISEIERLGATQAIILGGEAAVSSEIAQQLKALGLTTERIAGDNRFETSALIADELTSTTASDTAVVVDGMEFADAMSIAPIAAREGMPIYLTKTKSLSNAEDLNEYTSTYIVGGENAVSKKVESSLNGVTRLHGLDRYETNRDVIKHFGIGSSDLYVATGLNFADALSGSVLAANNNSTVALVRGDVHSKLIDYLNSYPVDSFTILGGEAAVSNKVANTLKSYLNRGIVVEDDNEYRTPDANGSLGEISIWYDYSVGHTEQSPHVVRFDEYDFDVAVFASGDDIIIKPLDDSMDGQYVLTYRGGAVEIFSNFKTGDTSWTMNVYTLILAEPEEGEEVVDNDDKPDSYYESDRILEGLDWVTHETYTAYLDYDDLFIASHAMPIEEIEDKGMTTEEASELMLIKLGELEQAAIQYGYVLRTDQYDGLYFNDYGDISFYIMFE